MKRKENSDDSFLPIPDGQAFVLYRTDDGRTKVEVRFEGDSVWLSQRLMAELYQVTIPTINEHIKTIYEDGELSSEATIRNFRIVQREGSREVTRSIEYYNLDMILAVGYRVRSHRGVQFRQWATERLSEYIKKGFTLDDDRLKSAGGGGYFEELLQRIRDIRSSEKVFWRKVLDIYATSVDYDPTTELSKNFFASVQNKMHYATHGQTAAEVIASRANAELPAMGLTSWSGDAPKRTDIAIAKNYLTGEELDTLNRIVTAYLEFAELQALNRKPMYMQDWIVKLDDFLKLTDREILTTAGTISHQSAIEKAETEYARYLQNTSDRLTRVEKDFLEAAQKIEKSLPPPKTGRRRGTP